MNVDGVQYSDAFGSHVILLAAALARTDHDREPILEIGCGEFSTPLMHEVAKVTRRPLVTVERQTTWADRFADLWVPLEDASSGPLGTRQVAHYFTRSLERAIDEFKVYGVALVDGDAGDRARATAALRNKARFVIVHDTEPSGAGHYPGLIGALGLYPYRYDYTRGQPWSTVVSEVPW